MKITAVFLPTASLWPIHISGFITSLNTSVKLSVSWWKRLKRVCIAEFKTVTEGCLVCKLRVPLVTQFIGLYIHLNKSLNGET
jgi:hypothetical protein